MMTKSLSWTTFDPGELCAVWLRRWSRPRLELCFCACAPQRFASFSCRRRKFKILREALFSKTNSEIGKRLLGCFSLVGSTLDAEDKLAELRKLAADFEKSFAKQLEDFLAKNASEWAELRKLAGFSNHRNQFDAIPKKLRQDIAKTEGLLEVAGLLEASFHADCRAAIPWPETTDLRFHSGPLKLIARVKAKEIEYRKEASGDPDDPRWAALFKSSPYNRDFTLANL